ncbi:hypothetical protein BD324DRAFT_94682 [Kockovaella imperatae]|uniref:Zn(2)-C6 fungal-type domain-containing protein n=1 Tax=Kockovaella imperatae TaxID=4999 RepID=A0A1Y1UBM2_9TREE|nr:hypothetical protein BD324DRAFT_94682 [Kockovaella imperatae]ORX35392.1 hypothetical protein BD324DRAFT_94682 [Kockovaella imperatae]
MNYQSFLATSSPFDEFRINRPSAVRSSPEFHESANAWSLPTHNPSFHQNSSQEGDGTQDTPGQKRKAATGTKRGYRACVHCRMRKAKCDLGDTDAPSKPPCSRCKREMRNCVFLPTKRRKHRSGSEDDYVQIYPAHSETAFRAPISDNERIDSTSPGSFNHVNISVTHASAFEYEDRAKSVPPHSRMFPVMAYHDMFGACGADCKSPIHRQLNHFPKDNNNVYAQQQEQGAIPIPLSTLSPALVCQEKVQNQADRILASDLANETDALELLVTAVSKDSKNGSEEGRSGRSVSLDDYILVKQGLLSSDELVQLVQTYFQQYHWCLPIVQTRRIPKSDADIAQLSAEEPFLVSALVLVASRHHPQLRTIHDKVWPVARQSLADYTLYGLSASIGLVEGILILAEFLPRQTAPSEQSALILGKAAKSPSLLDGDESRRFWALVGLALRAAYALGLDTIAMDIPKDRSAWKERARGVWTWCYLFDRTIDDLRTGLAFWARAPQISFIGFSHSSQTGETAARFNFPTMTSVDGTNDDACFVQSHMELTEIMTAAHDMLYPTKGRTSRLMRQGTYIKFVDQFIHSLDLFRKTWSQVKFKDPRLQAMRGCLYHFARLYVTSFCFQAHCQRAHNRAAVEKPGILQLFPTGAAASPDAVHIFESIEAADKILKICLELGNLGVLQYLPNRFLINFVYAGVFALKAAHSGAMDPKGLAETRRTIERMCSALFTCCPTGDHPATRYGNKLRILAKQFDEPESPIETPQESSANPMVTLMSTIPPTKEIKAENPVPPVADSLFDFGSDGTSFNFEAFFDDYTLLGENSGFSFM